MLLNRHTPTAHSNEAMDAPDDPGDMPTNMLVAANIRVEMLRRGLRAVPQLSEWLHQHPSTIRKKLQNTSTFDTNEVGDIAARLGINPAKLFEYDNVAHETR